MGFFSSLIGVIKMATSYSTNVYSAITLDCVNDIIGSIGEMQSSSLDTSNSDVVNALRILDRENRKLQSEGWTFNIQRSARLSPDSYSRMIKFNADYISMLEPNKQTVYVNRDGYVFDRVKQTNFFDSAITVDLITMLPLEEMPDCFLQLIVARSARRFNNEYFGAPEIDGKWQQEEQRALIQCNMFETDYGDYNMLTGDNYIKYMSWR